ncbi:MAG: hypothetical protein R3C49_10310 [Planctomycetaceae bacterium]
MATFSIVSRVFNKPPVRAMHTPRQGSARLTADDEDHVQRLAVSIRLSDIRSEKNAPADAEQPVEYCCPGEHQPVSEAVHLGRMAAGWAACRQCHWKTTDLPGTSFGRRDTIRRTESGVRGNYLNAIDRFRAAQLASIFSAHLNSVAAAEAAEMHLPAAPFPDASANRAASNGVMIPKATFVIGCDDRHGSADLMSGVISAVLQNGCDVIAVGQTSAAAIQYQMRRRPKAAAAMFVTGSGSPSGDVGLDVFDSCGRAISVPWQKFGVTVTTAARISHETSLRQTPPSVRDRLTHPAGTSATELHLPPLNDANRTPMLRTGRACGCIESVALEDDYLTWLSSWWPNQVRETVVVIAENPHTFRRLHRISAAFGSNLQLLPCRTGSEPFRRIATTFEIADDDRCLTVTSRKGRLLSGPEICSWLNSDTTFSGSHLTAHTTNHSQRILLVDAASPDSGHSQETICDAAALTGRILKALPSARFPLPQ